MTRSPPSTHSMATRPVYGTLSAMPAGFLNTPEPMTVPTTRAVATTGPRARARPDGEDCVGWFIGKSVTQKRTHHKGTKDTKEDKREKQGNRAAVSLLPFFLSCLSSFVSFV